MYQAVEAIHRKGVVHPLEPVHFEENERLIVLRLSRARPAASVDREAENMKLDSLFGILKSDQGVSLEEMKAIIKRRAKESLYDCS